MFEEPRMRILQSNDLPFHFQILLYDNNQMDLDFKAILYNYFITDIYQLFINQGCTFQKYKSGC